jgi:putative PIN family toxin of toxin-antitoxin system
MPPPTAFVVLDTNVVLDWLVFDNGDCHALSDRIRSGEWRWLATQAMADELAAVLQYPLIQRWNPDAAKVWQHWTDWVQPMPATCHSPLRCSDADDQKFIDLALAHQAQWLFTRDRALLKLARRARAWQVSVCPPGAQAGSELAGNLAATAAATSLR